MLEKMKIYEPLFFDENPPGERSSRTQLRAVTSYAPTYYQVFFPSLKHPHPPPPHVSFPPSAYPTTRLYPHDPFFLFGFFDKPGSHCGCTLLWITAEFDRSTLPLFPSLPRHRRYETLVSAYAVLNSCDPKTLFDFSHPLFLFSLSFFFPHPPPRCVSTDGLYFPALPSFLSYSPLLSFGDYLPFPLPHTAPPATPVPSITPQVKLPAPPRSRSPLPGNTSISRVPPFSLCVFRFFSYDVRRAPRPRPPLTPGAPPSPPRFLCRSLSAFSLTIYRATTPLPHPPLPLLPGNSTSPHTILL